MGVGPAVTYRSPSMITTVGPVVLHTWGVTVLTMGDWSSRAALYSAVAHPAAVDTFTVPVLALVTHSSWV